MTATDNSKMSSTPKRTRITYKKRQEIVLASKKPGFKIEDAAKEYGLGVSTLYKIVKEHEGGHGPREDVKCKKYSMSNLYEQSTPSRKLIKPQTRQKMANSENMIN